MLMFIGCSDTSSEPLSLNSLIQDLQSMHYDRYLDITYQSHQPKTGGSDWEIYYYDTSDCQCIEGSDFFISVRDYNSDSVVFYLEGGGACWPALQDECSKTANTGSSSGFSSTQEDYELKDWNAIYMPYCDGSVHSGDNEADYDGDGSSDHIHWGFRHLTAGVNLMKELFPGTQNILICGSSAGGYGTFLGYAAVRFQFPDSQIQVLNDAGPGLFNDTVPLGYDSIKQAWQHEQYVSDNCRRCDEQLTYLYEYYLERDPSLYIGMFTSYQDQTIGMGYLWMAPQDFEDLLLEITDDIHNQYPDRFKRFFVKGNAHTIWSVGFDYEVDEVSIRNWIEQLVARSPEWDEHLE